MEKTTTIKDLVIKYYGEMSEENLAKLMGHSSLRCLWRKGSAAWNNIHECLEDLAFIEEFKREDKRAFQLDYGYFYFTIDEPNN